MADPLTKFNETPRIVTSSTYQMRESVYCACVDHLSGIDLDDLPEDVQIIYKSSQPAFSPFIMLYIPVTFLFSDFRQAQIKFLDIGILLDLFN